MVTKTQRQLLLMNGIRWYNIWGGLLKTRQTTAYHVGDDGDYEAGLAADYTVMSTGSQSGTTAIDVPHYAAATLAFVAATKKITDSANGLVTFLTGDTIRVRGSTGNDGVYTVATGGVAGEIVTTEALADELAGAYITICKRASPSNNLVMDNVTGLMWKRTNTGSTGVVEKIGPTSNGKLNFYDTATCFTLHPAAADLQMMTTGIKIIGGAGEIARYFVGMIIDPSGFANAVNNLPGYRVTSVAVNGADLDILLWTGKNTLIAEAAAGARDIRVVCQSTFGYAAAANAASFGGYTDWRIPNNIELMSLMDVEAVTAYPDVVAFPTWGVNNIYGSETVPSNTTTSVIVHFGTTQIDVVLKTLTYCTILVRGGDVTT
jgi:hypothetical protein